MTNPKRSKSASKEDNVSSSAAQRIRKACLDGMAKTVEKMVLLASGEPNTTPASVQVQAFEALGRYALKMKMQVVVQGKKLVRMVVGIAKEVFQADEVTWNIFIQRVQAEMKAMGEDGLEDLK